MNISSTNSFLSLYVLSLVIHIVLFLFTSLLHLLIVFILFLTIIELLFKIVLLTDISHVLPSRKIYPKLINFEFNFLQNFRQKIINFSSNFQIQKFNSHKDILNQILINSNRILIYTPIF